MGQTPPKRKLCPNCKETYIPEDDKCQMIGIDTYQTDSKKFYRGKGCPICFHSGYRGRTGVFEFLKLDSELKSAITQCTDKQVIKSMVKERDFVSMLQNGKKLIENGMTTVEEVYETISQID